MAAYCEMSNLPGFAKWMRMQALEEQEHAMKIINYINDRGDRVVLQGIDQPPTDFKSPTDIFERILEHEKKVTSRINNIYSVAV
jgi:ferritin